MNRSLIALAGVSLVSFAGIAAATLGASGKDAAAPALERGVPTGLASYSVDPVHSSVVFKVRHVGAANFYGRFNEIKGSLQFDEGSGELSGVSIEIPIESVDSNNERRDAHLKNADFFNARQYPTASFTSTGFTKTADGGVLTGEFTMHGVTREIKAKVVDFGTGMQGPTEKMGFEAQFTVTRSDFGMTKYLAEDGSDSGPLGNRVTIIVAIEANKG
ncbi:MAG: YceI family protein [Phycisphaerales bacterium JB037]